MIKDIVIVGSGPAGLTAAIYLGRAGLNPCIIAGNTPGGQLIKTSFIENYPGFDTPIGGAELMSRMISQAENYKTDFMYDTVLNILKTDNNLFEIKLESSTILLAKSVLIATGATHKKLNIPGETELSNKGVSWCATCDGPIYRNKKVAVIGGGNTAVMETLFLSNFAESVTLIHRRSTLRADKLEQEKLFNNKLFNNKFGNKINILWNTQVTKINGTDKVESINISSTANTISNNINNACVDNICVDNTCADSTCADSTCADSTCVDNTIPMDGVFIAIGTSPASDFVKELVALDDGGYVIANNTETSCPGVFVAGDVASDSLKQAIYAAGQGALAASKIEQYLGIR